MTDCHHLKTSIVSVLGTICPPRQFPCIYGTPIFITIEERKQVYNTDFSFDPALEKQRDVFVFQSLVGCRISDLYAMTRRSIINGAVEYIPRKTKDGRPVVVRVPLLKDALEILDR